MLFEHQAVIHLVDMVAGKDEHMLWLLGANRVYVLVDSVGRSLVPLIADPLHRGEHFDKLPHFARDYVPALTNVPVERERLVLREDVNPAEIGIDAVGKRDVDDAVDSANGYG